MGSTSTDKPQQPRVPDRRASDDIPAAAKAPGISRMEFARRLMSSRVDDFADEWVFNEKDRRELHELLKAAQPLEEDRSRVIGRLGASCSLARPVMRHDRPQATQPQRKAAIKRLEKAIEALELAVSGLDSDTRVCVGVELRLSEQDGCNFEALQTHLAALRAALSAHLGRLPERKVGRVPSTEQAAKFLSMVNAELRDAGVSIVTTREAACNAIGQICLKAVGRSQKDSAAGVNRFLLKVERARD